MYFYLPVFSDGKERHAKFVINVKHDDPYAYV
jgi:hypothetical protein